MVHYPMCWPGRIDLSGTSYALARNIDPRVALDPKLPGQRFPVSKYKQNRTSIMPKHQDTIFQTDELPEDKTLLVVDDDAAFLERMSRAMAERGFEVRGSGTVARALTLVGEAPPAFAVIDLRLSDGSGLDVVAALRAARPSSRIIMLTGYGNLPTAVHAVKLGAIDYLTKPADADDLTDALLAPPNAHASPPGHPISPDRARWLHIQSVFQIHNRNVSETARRLNMHRRTLQRILLKAAPV
jgi:two-component system, response regulator RegA